MKKTSFYERRYFFTRFLAIFKELDTFLGTNYMDCFGNRFCNMKSYKRNKFGMRKFNWEKISYSKSEISSLKMKSYKLTNAKEC